jgi:hypothetical protein
MTDWLTEAFGYRIERIAVPHSSERIHPPVPAGVLHTTEGSWESALSVFRQHYAPTFMVGRDKTGHVRIAQFCPLGYMSAALEHNHAPETNRWATAQIELVAHSSERPWSVGEDVEDALAALMAKLKQEQGIRLRRPFSDTMPPGPWAVESFSRRHAGFWGKWNGWYGHVEIPGNAHWDPGCYKWGPLMEKAQALLAPPPPPPPAKAVRYSVTVEKPIGTVVKRISATEKPGPVVHDLGIVAHKYDKVVIRRTP